MHIRSGVGKGVRAGRKKREMEEKRRHRPQQPSGQTWHDPEKNGLLPHRKRKCVRRGTTGSEWREKRTRKGGQAKRRVSRKKSYHRPGRKGGPLKKEKENGPKRGPHDCFPT